MTARTGARHRRTTCEFCGHLIAVSKMANHASLCEKRTPEEREEHFKLIEARRRHQASKQPRARTRTSTDGPKATVDTYEALAEQVQIMYPNGVPTKDSRAMVNFLHWTFTTFHMLKQRSA